MLPYSPLFSPHPLNALKQYFVILGKNVPRSESHLHWLWHVLHAQNLESSTLNSAVIMSNQEVEQSVLENKEIAVPNVPSNSLMFYDALSSKEELILKFTKTFINFQKQC